MAKAAKKVTKEKQSAYGVADVAEALGIQPASARIALRKAEIEREGKNYSWNSKTEFQKVVKQLKENKSPAAA